MTFFQKVAKFGVKTLIAIAGMNVVTSSIVKATVKNHLWAGKLTIRILKLMAALTAAET